MTGEDVFPCDSEIYCKGPLLNAAQNAFVFNDSKSFVDMKLKQDPDAVLAAFADLNQIHSGQIPVEAVKQFVAKYFDQPGSEFEDWVPLDWTQSPQFLSHISDPQLRTWASDLNVLWKQLGRKMIGDVFVNSSRYSVIPVKNPVIVPGGRFREFYYWDSYFVIRGLLLSEMYTTVKGMIENFLQIIEEFDFIPNGGRIYYTRRSQPPYLIAMVKEYVEATGDKEFLNLALPTLEKEYYFWMNHRNIEINGHMLNYYASDVNTPRPESYREDSDVIKDLSPEDANSLLSHVTSACESGWDFSTRWAGTKYSSEIEVVPQLLTRTIIPVDLNSIMAFNERTLAEFYRIIGNNTQATTFYEIYEKRAQTIESIMWNQDDNSYYDYVATENSQNKVYFASNMNPLWTKCFPSTVNVTEREERMFQYLKTNGVLEYPGGIPTSLRPSGEQWDFPNAWPPLVLLIIEGLATSNSSLLQNAALQQASKWVNGNYKAYLKSGFMFEKYDVTQADGVAGSGGEYDVQVGFGWTNGVVMSLLDRYGDTLKFDSSTTPSVEITSSEMTTSSCNVIRPITSQAALLYFSFISLLFCIL
uniref:trehalase isoform X1 n=2 Tax=Ciona intestinalis TaxID=7719 RepID=UPI000180B916|nr:trehalase isoform X1 [Ciona intestinalis]|eukprot:XP_002131782.1 trehalase isoform X1 [Ciona intestinalis]